MKTKLNILFVLCILLTCSLSSCHPQITDEPDQPTEEGEQYAIKDAMDYDTLWVWDYDELTNKGFDPSKCKISLSFKRNDFLKANFFLSPKASPLQEEKPAYSEFSIMIIANEQPNYQLATGTYLFDLKCDESYPLRILETYSYCIPTSGPRIIMLIYDGGIIVNKEDDDPYYDIQFYLKLATQEKYYLRYHGPVEFNEPLTL